MPAQCSLRLKSGTSHALLLAGLGWGNMPEPMVPDDLRAAHVTMFSSYCLIDPRRRQHHG
jgi:hypothetical protein